MQEYGDSKRAQALWDVDSDDEEEDILEPNPKLSQGNFLLLEFSFPFVRSFVRPHF